MLNEKFNNQTVDDFYKDTWEGPIAQSQGLVPRREKEKNYLRQEFIQMLMEKLFHKKTVALFIGIISLLIIIFYIKGVDNSYSNLAGVWVIEDNYIYPRIGFNSKGASAKDLVGQKININSRWNGMNIQWGEKEYDFLEKELLDEDKLFYEFALKSTSR